MKHLSKLSLLLASVLMLSLTSCLREAADPNSGEGYLPSNVATLDEQVASMKTSINAMESLQTTLSEITSLENITSQFEGSVVAVKEHIASIEAGLSDVNATLATMRLQKEIANVTGVLKIQVASLENPQTIQAALLSLENGVSTWLGKDFNNFVGVSSELAGLSVLTESVESQSLTTEALTSDVEAGLRVGDATEELAAMVKTVASNAQTLAKLTSELDALSTEVEDTYTNAIKSTGSDTADALKNVNTKAAAALKSSAVTLADLASRVSDCETEIADIQGRLTQIEASVAELLSKIQSLTFMSQYSEEYALAYYSMEDTKVSAPGKPYDGKNKRTPVNNIELNYMVRPAAAASAVTKDVVSVVGYYADRIQTKSIDPTRFVNFAVTDVSVNAERGIVTVTVSHDLKDDFYYRQTGAKCALFIATGKTDISSKFVELYPKDNSTTVYVESIKINQDDFEIDEGQTKNLTATVNPSSATNKTIKWTSSNTEIATIEQYSGVLTAVKQGNVTITATTNDINEWGDNLTASVNVKVNPSIRLGGPLYVEEGKTAELSLDFPPAMIIESKVWMSSDETKATVDKNGVVTGVAHTYNEYTYQYNPITITCIVNGNITLTHEMSVAVPQPRQIKLNNYGDDVKSVSMKLDQTISLAGSILPANVNASLFRLTYESDGGLGWINFDTGEIKAPGSVGGRYVYIKVKDIDKQTYLKTFVERTVIVNVEPYYVKTMRFAQENFTLPPGQTATILPIFTSDVENMPPTSTKLAWESSAPEVVSVDPSTGEMTSHTEGTAVITATTSEASAVPSGHAPVSASFTVIAETPTKPVYVGDYFYSDGDWSTELILDTDGDDRADRSVVGIVFSNVPATSDARLMEEYPAATHGLVVGLVEYTEPTGYYSNVGWDSNSGIVVKAAGYDIFNTNIANGYTNTIGLKEYSKTGDSGYDLSDGSPLYYAHLFRDDAGVFAEPLVATPSGASTWYIPSYYEMSLMKANLTTINNAFAKLREEQLSATDISSSGQYSISTFKEYIRSVLGQSVPQGSLESICCYSISSGGWVSVGNNVNNPVRVVLAF